MSDQIIDIVEVAIPGATGDVTPELLAAKDAAELAAVNAHASEQNAEVWAANTQELQDLAVSSLGADRESLTSATFHARFVSAVMPEAFGSIGSGDDTALVQAAIDFAETAGLGVLLSAGVTYTVDKLVLPDGASFVVDGILKKKPNTTAPIISNSPGASNIHLTINGLIDGDKANQSAYVDGVGFIHFVESDNLLIDGAGEIARNYLPNAVGAGVIHAAVLVDDSVNVVIDGPTLRQYSREGVWFRGCLFSEQRNVAAHGDVDSWSGFQASGGSVNQINLLSENAGASGISFDTSGVQVNCHVKNNRWFHGFNYGHPGYPADAVVTGCTFVSEIENLSATSNGFNISEPGSVVRLSNCVADGAKTNGFSISNGSERLELSGVEARNCGRGLNAFGAVEVVGSNVDLRGNDANIQTDVDSRVRISNLILTDTTGYISYNRFPGSEARSLYMSPNNTSLISTQPFAAPRYSTASRPAASSVEPGSVVFDATLQKPVWSFGGVWRDAAGAVV